MTIGEKIQFYRKRSGLSQEELGNKLLISRQTVSLWEMDKTVPTVDNLIRLKEIFGVSIDDFLNGEEADSSALPTEKYVFSFSESEARRAISPFFRFLYTLAVFAIINAIIILIANAVNPSNDIAFIIFLALILPVVPIGLFISAKIVCKRCSLKLSKEEHLYELFDNKLRITVYNNKTVVKSFFINLNDIENVKFYNDFISFKFSGTRFYIKQCELIENSYFFTLTSKKSASKEKKRSFSIVSLVLFIVSLASIIISVILLAIVSGINDKTVSNMWIFFPVALIPFSSFVFGIVSLTKGQRGIKNIIAGIIMTIFLCIYGSFCFLNTETNDDTYYLKAQEVTGIELPEYSRAVYDTVLEETRVHLSKEVASSFEEGLKSDSRWLNGIPTTMQGLLPFYQGASSESYEYCIFYSLSDNTLNELPKANGKHNFITILYDCDNNCFTILDYEIEYKH